MDCQQSCSEPGSSYRLELLRLTAQFARFSGHLGSRIADHIKFPCFFLQCTCCFVGVHDILPLIDRVMCAVCARRVQGAASLLRADPHRAAGRGPQERPDDYLCNVYVGQCSLGCGTALAVNIKKHLIRCVATRLRPSAQGGCGGIPPWRQRWNPTVGWEVHRQAAPEQEAVVSVQ